jgi:hypothetical protein
MEESILAANFPTPFLICGKTRIFQSLGGHPGDSGIRNPEAHAWFGKAQARSGSGLFGAAICRDQSGGLSRYRDKDSRRELHSGARHEGVPLQARPGVIG